MHDDVYPIPVEEVPRQMVDEVQEVECPAFALGQVRRAGEEVRVPQRQLAVTHRQHVEELHRHVQLRVVNPGETAEPEYLPVEVDERQEYHRPQSRLAFEELAHPYKNSTDGKLGTVTYFDRLKLFSAVTISEIGDCPWFSAG
jgi:hypothetical protein